MRQCGNVFSRPGSWRGALAVRKPRDFKGKIVIRTANVASGLIAG
jgi:hypothetical protein